MPAPYRGGMRRRLMVAKAMVHSPPILVLDEPTAGVDVELRQQLWAHVRSLNRAGTTILLTTHYLQEAEELCDQIAIINHGAVVALDTTAALLARVDQKELRLTLNRDLAMLPPALQNLPATLEGTRTLILRYPPSGTDVGALLRRVQDSVEAAGLAITDITTAEAHLEDIFLQLTSAAVHA